MLETSAAAATRAVSELTRLNSEVARMSRTHREGNVLSARATERSRLRNRVAESRAAERAARTNLREKLEKWLPENPRDEVARLSADYPIVFLPIRIETRFDLRAPERSREWQPSLMVRIYPDEIAITTHEPTLTPAEYAAGTEYWTRAWNASDEPEAWRTITMAYPATRAAWIVQATTPTNIASRGTGDPQIPQLTTQPESWTRPAVTRVLPDRWIVLAFRGETIVAQALSNAVLDPLAVSMDPSADPDDPNETTDVSGHDLKLDHDILWTVDFVAAERVGMGLRIPLTSADLGSGFSQLIVLGVKSSLPPADAAKRLADLFDAHHYTGGFSVLRNGTATNNTRDVRSGFPAPDLGGAHSYPIERGVSLNRDGGNGRLFARALGLPDSVTDHVEHADLLEQANARAMNEALWPCTFGYFLRQMMNPVFNAGEIDQFRRYFVENVRGRGSLPNFRVGETPYGLLPVTSLQRWDPGANASGLDAHIAPTLRRLVSVWTEASINAPRIGRTADPETDLLEVLSMDGSSRQMRIRAGFGPTFRYNVISFMGISINFPNLSSFQQMFTRLVLETIGFPEWDPLITHLSFNPFAEPFAHELVATLLSEVASIDPNYIRWIRNATVKELRAQLFPSSGVPPKALLYHFLRHAALTEYAFLAEQLTATAVAQPVAELRSRPDSELVGFTAGQPKTTAWQLLENRIPELTGSLTIAEYLTDRRRETDGSGAQPYRNTLAELENLSTAELDRLFTETLDTCSHRLDAWVSSLASRRLREMRGSKPDGVHLAAYGWVEDLRPGSATRASVERTRDGRSALVQTGTGGYIQGPSMTHAATAAVLRNAYLTRSAENQERYRIDVSSQRVRTALWILDAVREGQQIGAVLGYQFERGLHESGVALNRFIDIFRRYFPLVANKASDSGEPAEAVAARNVVDGLRLRNAYRQRTIFGQSDKPDIPAQGSTEGQAIEAELKALDDAADAVTDLLTAEGVFQIMRGNMAAAGATLDTLAQGMRPPEPEIARQPRGGTSLTHRVAVILGSGMAAAADWNGIAATPRSSAEPRVDEWIGKLLGDPDTIRCRISYLDPQPGDPEHRTTKTVTLEDLDLRPIDFMALAFSTAKTGAASELDLRVAWAAGAPDDADADIRIDYSSWPNRDVRSFPEAIEVVVAFRDVIGAARPLRPEDLVPPENAATARSVVLEAGNRGTNAGTALQQARTNLQNAVNTVAGTPVNSFPDLSTLRTRLRAAAAFGISGAFPSTRSTSSPTLRAEILEQGRTVLNEIDRRIGAVAAAPEEDAKARAVLGRDFVFLYDFQPAESTELAQAVAASPALAGDRSAILKWFQKTAPVRQALVRWRKLATYAQIFGSASLDFDVVQLPFSPGASWVALPFADEEHRPPPGRLSIVMHRAAQPAANAAWAGFVIDEWSEVIPGESEQTAVAFHYDDPGAEAPQVILVGVPPAMQAVRRGDERVLVAERAWDFDSIVAMIRETLQLAKIRAVDLEMVGVLGQLLPAVYLASNAAEETVSTNLTAMVTTEPVIAST